MSEDKLNIGGLGFNFGISKKDEQIKLKEGEVVILRHWNWKVFGYIRRAYTLKNGKVIMQRLQ